MPLSSNAYCAALADTKLAVRSGAHDARQTHPSPAMYPSVAQDGSVLYVSTDGLRVSR